MFGCFFSFSASQGVFWVILEVPLGTLGAHLVLLGGLWGLLWAVFGIAFRGLLAPLGQSGSLGESWGRFLMLLGTIFLDLGGVGTLDVRGSGCVLFHPFLLVSLGWDLRPFCIPDASLLLPFRTCFYSSPP